MRYYRDDKWMKEVGERIREIRVSKNISQQELADECGVDLSQINRIELGKVHFGFCFFKKLGAGLKVNPAKFIS